MSESNPSWKSSWKLKIALFFSFTLLDESLAIVAIKETLLFLGRRFPGKEPSDAQLVSACLRYFKKYEKKRTPIKDVDSSIFAGTTEPDFTTWIQMVDRYHRDSLTTLTFSKILQIADADIAEGLRQSEGAIRFRVSKALQKMGTALRPSP